MSSPLTAPGQLINRKKISQLALVVVCLSSLSGCSTSPQPDRATGWLPSWDRVQQSALNAATDPVTWAPLVGAAVFNLGDLDDKTVKWATDKSPVFGSPDNAGKASDVLADLSQANYLASVVASPADPLNPWLDKSRQLGWGIMAYQANKWTYVGLKSAVGRERPNGGDRASFPSGHTAGATLAATLAAQNIDRMPLGSTSRYSWLAATYGTAGLTGWARVEAGVHHPSDVLAGWALGHFMGKFVNEAFIDKAYQDVFSVAFDVGPEQTNMVKLNYRW